jgi:hypothetical protein
MTTTSSPLPPPHADFSGTKSREGGPLGCADCGGLSGHTIRCPQGPGPAEAPTFEELWAVVSALEYPELAVRIPGRDRPVEVPSRPLAWRGFLRWASRRPAAALATCECLEAFERAWRAEAPTPEGVMQA